VLQTQYALRCVGVIVQELLCLQLEKFRRMCIISTDQRSTNIFLLVDENISVEMCAAADILSMGVAFVPLRDMS
jgi:hypothetical protein